MIAPKLLAQEVNNTLGAYVRVHDAIFAFSFRKLLPIPGLFEAIDYCAHEQTLQGLAARLRDVSARQLPSARPPSESQRAFLDALRNYAVALEDTISRLANISASLCRKSKGEPGYQYDTYQEEVKAYDESVQKYVALGQQLNNLYAGV